MAEIVSFFKTIKMIRDAIDFFYAQWIRYDIKQAEDQAKEELDEKVVLLLALQDAKEKRDATQVRSLARLIANK